MFVIIEVPNNRITRRKRLQRLWHGSREDDRQKLLVVCSYTDKEVAFKAPGGFDLSGGTLLLQNYADPTPNRLRPYEVRAYLWEK